MTMPERAGTASGLRASAITKGFGHIRALEDVSLSVRPGEVLALVGDNGAGKSTLVKILTGALAPDAGQLRVDGEPVRFGSPADARRHGIAAVFQELALVECLDIATNVFLGELPRRWIFVDRRRMDEETSAVLREMDAVDHSPRTPVGLLPAGHRQVIAIARAVRSQSAIIVMDEPTAALGVSEKLRVGQLIERLKAAGKAVALVSHDLQLVFDHADRIQVLRLGRTASVLSTAETDRDEVVGLITGALT